MAKIFLNTDVVINILKKREDTIKKLKSFNNEEAKFFISPVVIAEIYAGAKEKEYEQIEKLFSYFTVLDLTPEVGYVAGKYAKKYKKAFNKISLEDYFIAATVKVYDLKLWTYNKKHYPMPDIEQV